MIKSVVLLQTFSKVKTNIKRVHFFERTEIVMPSCLHLMIET